MYDHMKRTECDHCTYDVPVSSIPLTLYFHDHPDVGCRSCSFQPTPCTLSLSVRVEFRRASRLVEIPANTLVIPQWSVVDETGNNADPALVGQSEEDNKDYVHFRSLTTVAIRWLHPVAISKERGDQTEWPIVWWPLKRLKKMRRGETRGAGSLRYV